MSLSHIGKTTKKIKQYNKEGIYIKTWESIIKCSIELNLSKKAISHVIRGTRKSVGEFMFTYDDNTTNNIHPYKNDIHKSIHLINDLGEIIKTYDTIVEASKDLNLEP